MQQFDRSLPQGLSALETQMMMDEISKHNRTTPDFVDPRQPYDDSRTMGQYGRDMRSEYENYDASKLRTYKPPVAGGEMMAPPPPPGNGTHMQELYNQMPMPGAPRYNTPSIDAQDYMSDSVSRQNPQPLEDQWQLLQYYQGGTEI